MAASPYIVEVTAANFEEVVLNGSFKTPVLVDFWADWCQPCKALMPVLAKLAGEFGGAFILAKLNTEQEQAVAAQFGIRSIPAVKLVHEGRIVDEFVGALPEAQIREFLDRHIARESDGLVGAAMQAIQRGDVAEAIHLADEARAADPGNGRVLIGYARIKTLVGDLDAAEEALAALPADAAGNEEAVSLRAQIGFTRAIKDAPPLSELEARVANGGADSETLYQVACHLVLEDRPDEALEALLGLLRKDRRYGDDAARKAMLAVFDLLGPGELTTRYRNRMFAALH